MAYRRPKIVTRSADNFVVVDIVITVVFIGVRVEVIRRPAMMLPSASRMMGLVSVLLFSSIKIIGAVRELLVCT